MVDRDARVSRGDRWGSGSFKLLGDREYPRNRGLELFAMPSRTFKFQKQFDTIQFVSFSCDNVLTQFACRPRDSERSHSCQTIFGWETYACFGDMRGVPNPTT